VGGGLGSLTSTAANLLGSGEGAEQTDEENSKLNRLPLGGRLSETLEP